MQYNDIIEDLKQKIDNKTKPLGALGQLEDLALQIGSVQQTLEPQLSHPTIVVFAADHGLTQSGVSAYPKSVTAQMVYNFLNGGAAINVFCQQHQIDLKIVDAGVDHKFPKDVKLIDYKIADGTQNCLYEAAMTMEQVHACLNAGENTIIHHVATACNIIGFGEMGIGNTSSASLLMSALTGLPIEECTGKGTGLNKEGIMHKIKILQQVRNAHPQPETVYEVMSYFGGFEIVQMCGAMLASYKQNKLIMVDGFIASAALLCASKIEPDVLKNAIFCHQSSELGHLKLLAHLRATPILQLNMRVGEGTGCALAYPLIKSAVTFLNNMASFDSAGVDKK